MSDPLHQTTLAKLAEIDRVIKAANDLLRLQGAKVVPCQWKIRAFLQGRKPCTIPHIPPRDHND